MDKGNESNHDLKSQDLFSTVNNYFLLFFSMACVLSSVYIQTLFVLIHKPRIGISVSALLGIALPIFLLVRRFPIGFRHQLLLRAPKAALVLYVVLVTLACVVIIDCIYLFSQRLLPAPVDFIEGLKILKPQGLWSFLITFLGICVVVPIAEELVFRGIVQRVFSRNMNPILAFVLAGIVFGGIHLDAHLLISISCFGIILGFIFYATNNLTYTILSHAVFNTVAFVQLSTTSPDLLETPPFYVQDVRFLIVSAILLVFFLRKIKKGGSYEETP